jgi:DNA-binding transcriptional MocR family regulator
MYDLNLEVIQLGKNHNKEAPLYQQIRCGLTKKIHAHLIKPGDTLPSITYLTKKWEVTYRTIKYEHLSGAIENSVRQLIPVELVVRASSVGKELKNYDFVPLSMFLMTGYSRICKRR